jgi:hypothetical protein
VVSKTVLRADGERIKRQEIADEGIANGLVERIEQFNRTERQKVPATIIRLGRIA